MLEGERKTGETGKRIQTLSSKIKSVTSTPTYDKSSLQSEYRRKIPQHNKDNM